MPADPVLQAKARYWQRVRQARGSLRVFTEKCARSEDGDRIQLDFVHLQWIHHLNYSWTHGKHAMILAPFGTGKSSTLAVPLAAFLIGTNQQIRIKVVANNDDYARRRVGTIRSIIETAEYHDVFPHIRPAKAFGSEQKKRWADHEFEVERERGPIDPTVQARGVLTAGVGTRADVIIFDDVCDQLNTSQAALRMKVKQFVSRTWLSRLDPKLGRALWIATPWDLDDATYANMHDRRWCTLVQRVAPDHLHYEQEVFNAGDDYMQGMAA